MVRRRTSETTANESSSSLREHQHNVRQITNNTSLSCHNDHDDDAQQRPHPLTTQLPTRSLPPSLSVRSEHLDIELIKYLYRVYLNKKILRNEMRLKMKRQQQHDDSMMTPTPVKRTNLLLRVTYFDDFDLFSNNANANDDGNNINNINSSNNNATLAKTRTESKKASDPSNVLNTSSRISEHANKSCSANDLLFASPILSTNMRLASSSTVTGTTITTDNDMLAIGPATTTTTAAGHHHHNQDSCGSSQCSWKTQKSSIGSSSQDVFQSGSSHLAEDMLGGADDEDTDDVVPLTSSPEDDYEGADDDGDLIAMNKHRDHQCDDTIVPSGDSMCESTSYAVQQLDEDPPGDEEDADEITINNQLDQIDYFSADNDNPVDEITGTGADEEVGETDRIAAEIISKDEESLSRESVHSNK